MPEVSRPSRIAVVATIALLTTASLAAVYRGPKLLTADDVLAGIKSERTKSHVLFDPSQYAKDRPLIESIEIDVAHLQGKLAPIARQGGILVARLANQAGLGPRPLDGSPAPAPPIPARTLLSTSRSLIPGGSRASTDDLLSADFQLAGLTAGLLGTGPLGQSPGLSLARQSAGGRKSTDATDTSTGTSDEAPESAVVPVLSPLARLIVRLQPQLGELRTLAFAPQSRLGVFAGGYTFNQQIPKPLTSGSSTTGLDVLSPLLAESPVDLPIPPSAVASHTIAAALNRGTPDFLEPVPEPRTFLFTLFVISITLYLRKQRV